MLENIKSSYILKKLFSNLGERNKLKLVKYNKRLQNNLDINLINYKTFTNKYIIYEDNGKVKEHNQYDILIFEGGYKNGERNGKGKEYNYDGDIIFDGEYLNGKRNGKGKEYDDNGKLIFEGYYKNGKQWKGKGYNNSQIRYELKDGNGFINTKYFKGEIKNGERNGKGKEYDEYGKLIFVGEYLNGKRWNGKGYNNKKIIYELKEGKGYIKEYNIYDGRLRFEGEYKNGERNGKGKEYSVFDGKLIFEGEYLYGNRRSGKEYVDNGNLMFEGEYLNEKRWNGRRMCRLKDKFIHENIKYEVEILEGKLWNGKIYDSNNNIICDWKEGKGFIKEYNDYGELRFEGEYLNGERNGKGKEYNYNGKLQFDGEYLNGERNGKGKEYYKDGKLKFEGEYKNGKRNGKGKEYNENNGDLIFEGEYLNGKAIQ